MSQPSQHGSSLSKCQAQVFYDVARKDGVTRSEAYTSSNTCILAKHRQTDHTKSDGTRLHEDFNLVIRH
jgi:hypothetical protein